MGAAPLTAFPEEHSAGDSLTLEKSLPSYSAEDGWTVAYSIVGATEKLGDFPTVGSGTTWTLTIAPTVTAGWAPARYRFVAYATSSDSLKRDTVDFGWVEVLPNLSATDGYDARTDARIALDAINAVLGNKATRDQASYSINGRSLSRIPVPDLLQLRDHFASLVATEEAKERQKLGKGGRPKSRPRFLT